MTLTQRAPSPSLPSSSQLPAAERAPLRVGVVGVGRWGRRLLDAVARGGETRSVAVVAVVAGGTGGAAGDAWLAEHHPRVRRARNGDDVFGAGDVDAVIIATPIDTHVALTRAALTAGKHVLVEKPLATSTADAQALVDLAAARRLTLGVGHVFLHHEAYAALGELTRDDAVVDVALTWHKLGTFDSDIWWNLTAHHASLALALLHTTPSHLRVRVLHERAALTERDAAAVAFEVDDGRRAVSSIDRASPFTAHVVKARTRSGRVYAWHDDGPLLELAPATQRFAAAPVAAGIGPDAPAAAASPLDREIRAFVAAVRDGAPLVSDGAHGVAVVELMSRLVASGSGGRS